MVKSSLKKRPKSKRGTTHKTPTLLELIPAESRSNNGKSPGNPVGELATQERNKQSSRGNEEKRIKSQGGVALRVGQTRDGNPLVRVLLRRNCRKVFRVHKLEQSMIRHSDNEA